MFKMPEVGGLGGGSGGSLGTVWAEFGLDTSKLRRGASEARSEMNSLESEAANSMSRLGSTMSHMGHMMTMTLTLPLAAFALLTVNAASQFEQAMARVEAVSGAVGQDFEALQGVAREMGKETSFSATQAAQGLEYLGMAGWEVNEMLSGLEPTLRLAEVAQMDLGRTTDIVSDIMTAFRMEATEAANVADVLAYGMMTANTNVQMLGDTMAYAAPTAASLGYDIEEVVAAAGRLADAGIKGSRAGTSLDAVFRDISNMSERATNQLEGYNIEIYDTDENIRSLVDIIADYESALEDATDKEQAHIKGIGFTSRALRGLNALLGTGSEELRSYTKELINSEGAVEKAGEAIRDTLRYQLIRLKSILTGILIDFGEVLLPIVKDQIIPAVIGLAETIATITGEISEWDSVTTTIVVTLGALLMLAGPIASALGWWISQNIALAGAVSTAVVALKGQVVAFNAVLATLGPANLLWIAAGIAIAGMTSSLIKTRKETRNLDEEMKAFIKTSESLDDLTDRYEELLDNTERTNEEQRELLEVTEQLSNRVPEAVEGWDDYNNALDINVEKTREASEEQRKLAKNVLDTLIIQQEDKVQQLKQQLGDVKVSLTEMDKLHQKISKAMEGQRDEMVTMNELIDLGIYKQVMDAVRATGEGWWDTQKKAAIFFTRLSNGKITLFDIENILQNQSSILTDVNQELTEEEKTLAGLKERMKELNDLSEEAGITPEEESAKEAKEILQQFEEAITRVLIAADRQIEKHKEWGQAYDEHKIKAELLKDEITELFDKESRNLPLIRKLIDRHDEWSDKIEQDAKSLEELITSAKGYHEVMSIVDDATQSEIMTQVQLSEEYDKAAIKISKMRQAIKVLQDAEGDHSNTITSLSGTLNELVAEYESSEVAGRLYGRVMQGLEKYVEKARERHELLNKELGDHPFNENAVAAEYLSSNIERLYEALQDAYEAGNITSTQYERQRIDLLKLSGAHKEYAKKLDQYDLAGAQADLNAEIEEAKKWNEEYGTELEANSRIADLLRAHISELRENGFSPLSKAVKDAYSRLQEYTGASSEVQRVMSEHDDAMQQAKDRYTIYGDEVQYAQERMDVLRGTVDQLINTLGDEGLQVESNANLVSNLREEYEHLESWLATREISGDLFTQAMEGLEDHLKRVQKQHQLLNQELGEVKFNRKPEPAEKIARTKRQLEQSLYNAYEAGDISKESYDQQMEALEALSDEHEKYASQLNQYDLAKAQEELNDEIKETKEWYAEHGTEAERNDEIVRLLTSHIQELRNEGFSPLNDAVQDAYERLHKYAGKTTEVQQILKDMEDRLSSVRATYIVNGDEVERAESMVTALDGAIKQLTEQFGEEGLQVEENMELIQGLREEKQALVQWIETEGEAIKQTKQIRADMNRQLEELEAKQELWKQEMSESEAQAKMMEEELRILETAMLKFAVLLGLNSGEVQELQIRINELKDELDITDEVDLWQIGLDAMESQLSTTLADMIKEWDFSIKRMEDVVYAFADAVIDEFARIAAKQFVTATVGSLVIPGLATGGIVTKPTVGVMGENRPEAIVPLDQLYRYFNAFGQSLKHIAEAVTTSEGITPIREGAAASLRQFGAMQNQMADRSAEQSNQVISLLEDLVHRMGNLGNDQGEGSPATLIIQAMDSKDVSRVLLENHEELGKALGYNITKNGSGRNAIKKAFSG